MDARPTITRRLLPGAFTLALVSGCAGTGSPPTWQPPEQLFPSSFANAAVASAPLTRLLDGTWRDGSSCPSLQPRPEPVRKVNVRRNGSTSGTLFVVNYGSSKVEEFDASGTNPAPLGSITSDLGHPWGASVDQEGSLYVANWQSADVLQFPEGFTNPTVTLRTEVLYPLDTGSDEVGNVWVVDGYGGPVLIFPPGNPTPQQLGGFSYPTQIAFDTNWNLYIVDQLYGTKPPLGAVWEIPAGSRTKKNLGLTGLNYPVGIAIDASNDIAISNEGTNDVLVYGAGKTTPKRTITSGICSPVFLAYNAAGILYVVDNATPPNGAVTGYKPTDTQPFVTLTASMANPRGITVNNNWQP